MQRAAGFNIHLTTNLPGNPPHRRVTYGCRAFAVAGPSTWNSLPKRLHDPFYSISVIGRLLETFLFLEC